MKDREALENYFSLLKSTLEDNDLMDKPSEIYNMDESGVPLDHRSPYFLTKKGQVCFVRKQGTKNCGWVHQCMRTSYTSLNCLRRKKIWICNGQKMRFQERCMDLVIVDGWTWNSSKLKHFLSYACSNQPILLLLDGHSSQYNLEAIDLAKENGVITHHPWNAATGHSCIWHIENTLARC